MTTILKIEKMHCRGCVKRVTEAIVSVAPHSKVKIDIEHRRLSIDNVDHLDEITNALDTAGYPAQKV